MGSAVQSTAGAFTAWFNAPFRQPVDVVQVFLIIGVIIVSAAVWHHILHRLHE